MQLLSSCLLIVTFCCQVYVGSFLLFVQLLRMMSILRLCWLMERGMLMSSRELKLLAQRKESLKIRCLKER
uniref:Uncharacterized protein n=1 Tax=Salix viminalis TaxID=40686 RepID=A0A6N2JZI2_SALVM